MQSTRSRNMKREASDRAAVAYVFLQYRLVVREKSTVQRK